MLSNLAAVNSINLVSSRDNSSKRFMYSVKDLSSLASFNSELDKGIIFSVLYQYKEVIKEIDSQTHDGVYGTFSFYITKNKFTIGKAANNDGVLAMNPAVSRSHLEVY